MALVVGTNCGFVTATPSGDPNESAGLMANYRRVTQFTSPATAAKITEIGWYSQANHTSTNFEIGVYADNGSDAPGDLLHVERTNVSGGTIGWKSVTVDWAIDASTKYWLALQCDDDGTNAYFDYANESGLKSEYAGSASDLPEPFNGTPANQTYSIYAIWEASAGNAIKLNIGDDWKVVEGLQINIGDAWKAVEGVQINIGDAWKTIL